MKGLPKLMKTWIERDGYVSYDQVSAFCDSNIRRYKVDTARRAIFNLEKQGLVKNRWRGKAVIGWEWAGEKREEYEIVEESKTSLGWDGTYYIKEKKEEEPTQYNLQRLHNIFNQPRV